jgi:hypothetical protein
MAQRNGNYTDENLKPVEGAEIYVYTMTGDVATITDTDDQPITHPVITDQQGNYSYRADDGYYIEHVWYGKRRVRIENGIFIGDPNLSFQLASEQLVADAAQVAADKVATETARGQAVTAKQGAEAAQVATEVLVDEAESAAIAAAAAGNKYATTGDGEADTVDGDFFVTPVAGGLAIWENVGGTATAWPAPAPDQTVIATAESLAGAVADVESAASTVGAETGNSAIRASLGGVDADTITRRAAMRYSAKSKALVSNRVISEKASTMRRAVRAHGHSAIQGSGVVLAGASINPHSGINGSLPRHLEYLLQTYDPEWSVCNHGVSAQSSSEIASRMGAIPIYITLGSGTALASSGAVACTCTPGTWGPFARRGTSVDTLDGYIGNQLCRLTNTGTGVNANSPIYSIEQIGGTASITVSAATQFTIADDSLDYAVNIFWATRNDNNNQLSWDMQGAMVEKLPQDERRYIVMGDWNTADGAEDTGSTRLTNILAENTELRRRFGGNFFDVRAFLRGEYPYDGTLYRTCWQVSGLSPSANDLADIALGRIPRVWMSFFLGGADYTHFNEVTYYWLAVALIEFHFKPKGWLLP